MCCTESSILDLFSFWQCWTVWKEQCDFWIQSAVQNEICNHLILSLWEKKSCCPYKVLVSVKSSLKKIPVRISLDLRTYGGILWSLLSLESLLWWSPANCSTEQQGFPNSRCPLYLIGNWILRLFNQSTVAACCNKLACWGRGLISLYGVQGFIYMNLIYKLNNLLFYDKCHYYRKCVLKCIIRKC